MLKGIQRAGVVGCGGAGFPTYAKLDCRVDYLLLNGAECEPLLQTDQYLLRNHSAQILAAVLACQQQIGAKELILCVKAQYKAEIAAFQAAVSAAGASVQILLLDSYYPAGDEQMLVREATGRIVPPGGIPKDVGVLVDNVATMLCVADALSEVPFTQKYLTIAGEVPQPQILQVPIGTALSECLAACGVENLAQWAYIIGGPMMGRTVAGEELCQQFVTKTTAGIIVLPRTHPLVNAAIEPQKMLNRAKSACIQCQYCTDLCPRHLQGHPLAPHRIMRKLAAAKDFDMLEISDDMHMASLCCECGICEKYACPMGLSPRRILGVVKQKLNQAGLRYTPAEPVAAPHPFLEQRHVPTGRLLSRLGLTKYAGQKAEHCQVLQPKQTQVLLKQHIGAAAVPVVQVGEQVAKGQEIAVAAANALSVPMHSGIDGVVREVSEKAIMIEAVS